VLRIIEDKTRLSRSRANPCTRSRSEAWFPT
jgi:hypothetical protein